MGISQQVGASSLNKPGVCTSTTRPATPYEGQMIYETDTDRVLVWNGAAWYANWNTAWGVVALGQTTTSTANVSVETLSVTSSSFTAVANRYYKCTYYEPAFLGNSGTINFLHMRIRLTNISGAIQAESFPIMDNTSGRNYGIVSVVKTFSAGSIVLCGTFLPTGGGNGQMFHDATRVGQIIVEDIGPA